jgi:hypothetical protein
MITISTGAGRMERQCSSCLNVFEDTEINVIRVGEASPNGGASWAVTKLCLACRQLLILALNLDFDEWLQLGVSSKYCTEQFCSTHDGTPLHPSEEAAWEEGGDPCCHVVRLGQPADWAING